MLLNHGGDAERSSTRVSSVPGAATWRHAAARSREHNTRTTLLLRTHSETAVGLDKI